MSTKVSIKIYIGTIDNVETCIVDHVDNVFVTTDGIMICGIHKSNKGRLKHYLGKRVYFDSHSLNINGAEISEVDKYGVRIYTE